MGVDYPHPSSSVDYIGHVVLNKLPHQRQISVCCVPRRAYTGVTNGAVPPFLTLRGGRLPPTVHKNGLR